MMPIFPFLVCFDSLVCLGQENLQNFANYYNNYKRILQQVPRKKERKNRKKQKKNRPLLCFVPVSIQKDEYGKCQKVKRIKRKKYPEMPCPTLEK
jgi:hypothetical protein